MHYLAPELRSVLFAIKGLAAVALALATAMSLDLDKPFWAMVASMMLQARPETGLVVEKATFLVLGSIAGSVIAMLILEHLMPYPELAIGCLTLCVAASSAVASTMRHVNFVFGTALISVTAILIVMFSMADPANTNSEFIFHVVRARLSEVIVGASCAVLASVLLFPLKVNKLLAAHTQKLLAATLAHADTIGSAMSDTAVRNRQRQAIIACATAISEDSNAGRYEEAGNISAALFMANKALTVIVCVQAIERTLQAHAGILGEGSRRIIEQVRQCFKAMSKMDDAARLDALETTKASIASNSSEAGISLTHPLLENLDALFGAVQAMLEASRAIAADAPFPNRVERFKSHRDLVVGLRAAIRSTAVFLACLGVWSSSEGPPALIMMVVLPVLFSQMFSGAPNPTLPVRKILLGGLMAIPVSIGMLGLLAQGTGSFETLLLVLSGPLFLGLLAMTSPALAPYGLGFCLSLAVLVQASNYMTFATDQALLTGLGIATGLCLLYIGFELLGPPKGRFLQSRIVKALGKDLALIGTRGRFEQWFNSRVAERLLYLNAFEAVQGHDSNATELSLAALELGHELSRLRTRPPT